MTVSSPIERVTHPGRKFPQGASRSVAEDEAAGTRDRGRRRVVGRSGMGPWEHEEVKVLLTQAVRRKIPVIPVLLPETRQAQGSPSS